MTSATAKRSKWFTIGVQEASDRRSLCDPPENLSQREYREYMRGWNSVRALAQVKAS